MFMTARLVLSLPAMQSAPEAAPGECPACQGRRIIHHGTLERPLRDPAVRVVQVLRYRCGDCGTTFRHYPAGVGRSQPSKRLLAVAAVLWWLGLSYAAIAQVLEAMGARLSPATLWRGVRSTGITLIPHRRKHLRSRLRDVAPAGDGEPCDLELRFLRDDTHQITGLEALLPEAKSIPVELKRALGAWGASVVEQQAEDPAPLAAGVR